MRQSMLVAITPFHFPLSSPYCYRTMKDAVMPAMCSFSLCKMCFKINKWVYSHDTPDDCVRLDRLNYTDVNDNAYCSFYFLIARSKENIPPKDRLCQSSKIHVNSSHYIMQKKETRDIKSPEGKMVNEENTSYLSQLFSRWLLCKPQNNYKCISDDSIRRRDSIPTLKQVPQGRVVNQRRKRNT